MDEFYFPIGTHLETQAGDEQPLGCTYSPWRPRQALNNSAAANIHISCTVEVMDDNTCHLVVSAVRADND